MKYFTSSDGLRLAYQDAGQGDPVLCLSGLTRTMDDFNYLAPHLSDYRLIRMDYRGRGGSDFDPKYQNYNLFREGKDAIELLDHLGVEKAALIGTSRGGLIGLTLAQKYKSRLAGILFNDIGPVLEPEGLEYIMGYLGTPPPYSNFAQAETLWPQTQTGFTNITDDRWAAEIRHRWAEGPEGLQMRYDPNLRLALEEADHGESVDLWAFYEALAGLPLALVRGVNSNLLSQETAQEMKRRRLDLIVGDVPDRGHIPFLDEPNALRAIFSFLRACYDHH